MSGKAVISLTTGLEDPEQVTVAFLVALGAAEQRRPTLIFLTKEAVRLALEGVAHTARHLGEDHLVDNATLGGTVPLWQWIGDAPATTFSY